MLQIGGRNHLIEVFQPHFIPGQQNNMLGKAVAFSAQGPQFLHLLVYRLEGVDPLFMEHLPKGNQHIAHSSRVIAGPVVIEGRQIQMLRHNIQLVLPQPRQKILGQNQRIDVRGVKLQSGLFASRPDKSDVELRIVGRQGAAIHKFQKISQGLFGCGRILQHLVSNACQPDDFRRQPAARVDKCLKTL